MFSVVFTAVILLLGRPQLSSYSHLITL